MASLMMLCSPLVPSPDADKMWSVAFNKAPLSVKENFVFICNKDSGSRLRKCRASCCLTDCSKGMGWGRSPFSCFLPLPFFPTKALHNLAGEAGRPGCRRPLPRLPSTWGSLVPSSCLPVVHPLQSSLCFVVVSM